MDKSQEKTAATAGKPADYWDPWVKRQRAKHE
jgi:hypothetical protein